MHPNKKDFTLLLFLLISSFSFSSYAKNNTSIKYYRHLQYNHVSPYITITGVHPINSIQAQSTSHYIFKYDNSNRIKEIINNHYHTEKVHPLASIGVYKLIFKYEEGKEIRTFYDLNNNRITNDRNVYKEVFSLNKKGTKIALKFYDLNDNPMKSNWGIARYEWEKSKKLIIERRYNLENTFVNLSPYFEFGITGIKLNKKGAPEAHYNLNEKLEVIENNSGVASYKDTYDEVGNHIMYSYHDRKGELVMNQWRFAIGKKSYNTIGNNIQLELLDTNQKIIHSRKVYSNSTIKLSPKPTQKDSLEIRKKSLGYLIALQKLDPVLMDTVLNDSLNKVTIAYNRDKEVQYGKRTTKEQMIEFAKSWNKANNKFPSTPSNKIKILDIYNRIATVKLVSDNWVEYLHLIKLDEKWHIINLIWQYKDLNMYPE